MSDPYVGEIRMFAGNYAPNGWAFCDGSLLPISQNEVLFALIGTIYGGDGQTTFALPDLRGRVPVHVGPSNPIGQMAGSENVTLNPAQLPSHNHGVRASTAAATPAAGPTGLLATSAAVQFYGSGAPSTPMAADATGPAGGNQPHTNMAPFQAVNFIIALFGIFPSPN
ncbi:MAG: phage tail protein [Zoogloeaceae bacterium]|nr:phage tail protein [Zoogloeaceae bacterium]